MPQQRRGIFFLFQAPGGALQRGGGALRRILLPEGQHLTGRQQQGLVQIAHPPLGRHVEGAHGVQLVAPEFTAHRLLHGRGKYVQYPAPQGELTGAFHLLAADVSAADQPRRQLFDRVALSHFQGNGRIQQHISGDTPLHCRVHCRHHQPGLTVGHGIQRRQTLILPAAAGRGGWPQLPLTPPQQRYLLSGQRMEIGPQLGRLGLVAAQQQHGPPRLLMHGRRQHGPVHGGYAGDHRLFAPQGALQQSPDLLRPQQFFQQSVHIPLLPVGAKSETPHPRDHPLNLFIALSGPSSIRHSAASAARSSVWRRSFASSP